MITTNTAALESKQIPVTMGVTAQVPTRTRRVSARSTSELAKGTRLFDAKRPYLDHRIRHAVFRRDQS